MHRAASLTTFMCRLSWNLGAWTSWNPQGLSRPVMGLLFIGEPMNKRSSEQWSNLLNDLAITNEFINECISKSDANKRAIHLITAFREWIKGSFIQSGSSCLMTLTHTSSYSFCQPASQRLIEVSSQTVSCSVNQPINKCFNEMCNQSASQQINYLFSQPASQ